MIDKYLPLMSYVSIIIKHSTYLPILASKIHLSVLLSLSSFGFATSSRGFGAAELGFKCRQPWEGEGERKNVRKRGGVDQEGGSVSEGGSGLAGP